MDVVDVVEVAGVEDDAIDVALSLGMQKMKRNKEVGIIWCTCTDHCQHLMPLVHVKI